MSELTAKQVEEVKAWEKARQHDCGRIDIEDCINIETEKFDRRKFGKLTCGLCGHKFNPFYYDSLESGEWKFTWVGISHKEPEQRHEVDCPNCGEGLWFKTCIGQ